MVRRETPKRTHTLVIAGVLFALLAFVVSRLLLVFDDVSLNVAAIEDPTPRIEVITQELQEEPMADALPMQIATDAIMLLQEEEVDEIGGRQSIRVIDRNGDPIGDARVFLWRDEAVEMPESELVATENSAPPIQSATSPLVSRRWGAAIAR